MVAKREIVVVADNHRNGSYPKTVLTEDGAVDLDVPRDRNGRAQASPRDNPHFL
jgi:transposase-like protein